jgi:transposase
MIPPEVRAEIRRLREIEGLRVNTIARLLGVHHSTVSTVIEQTRGPTSSPSKVKRRPSILDPYMPLITETLKKYPSLPATQLYEMLRRRGYPGGPDHVRHRISELGLRPRQSAEAFLSLRTLPGEQAQVDWGHFGSRAVAGGERRLYAFVMVLSYSRRIFLRFFYDARMVSFLTGHLAAFSFFGGVARTLLYDNLKSAVLERRGDAIRFHPSLLEAADYYGFEPRPVARYRGNEKGRVERAIRYIRTAFFPLRADHDILSLNREADGWCRQTASRRPWPQDRRRTVEQAYLEERGHLLQLPGEPLPCHERIEVSVRKSPYVHFDCNRYSVPHARVERQLTVVADLSVVRIFDGAEEVATHQRSWDKNQIVEDREHISKLWQQKRAARLSHGQDRLLRAVPRAEELLTAMARRQRHLATAVDRLLRLKDEFGRADLDTAIAEALDSGSPHPETVRLILDRRRRERHQAPPVAIDLPDNAKAKNLTVVPHDLSEYDPEDDS